MLICAWLHPETLWSASMLHSWFPQERKMIEKWFALLKLGFSLVQLDQLLLVSTGKCNQEAQKILDLLKLQWFTENNQEFVKNQTEDSSQVEMELVSSSKSLIIMWPFIIQESPASSVIWKSSMIYTNQTSPSSPLETTEAWDQLKPLTPPRTSWITLKLSFQCTSRLFLASKMARLKTLKRLAKMQAL